MVKTNSCLNGNTGVLAFCLVVTLLACQSGNISDHADLIIKEGEFFTSSKSNYPIQALAVKDGLIYKLGPTAELLKEKGPATKVIDAKGLFIMPGFIEGHGHFIALGKSLEELDFLDSPGWNEIIEIVSQRASEIENGEWIIGRGWHQDKWKNTPKESINGYPLHRSLSILVPNNPVILTHASGHALFANDYAMKLASITKESRDPVGGRIVRDNQNELSGIFEENAMHAIREPYAAYQSQISSSDHLKLWKRHIELAELECLKNGITSFQDAGSTFLELEHYKKMANDDNLDIRLWVMIGESLDALKSNQDYPYVSPYLTCRAVKSYVDGALGSYGAWLLDSYDDKPDHKGQNTTSLNEIKGIANYCQKRGLQFCVHAIGDRGNREILDIYARQDDLPKLRWRIEHAQHISPKDIPRFGTLGVIASMQGVHCTSDAAFVEKRLGRQRAENGSYAWRDLLDSNTKMANGSDTPVEKVSVLDGIYASVTRRNKNGEYPFFIEQSMTRIEALKSFTIWNAYAAHEEKIKGSLEIGKLADIVILDKNLLTCSDSDILKTNIIMTIVDGNIKYIDSSFAIDNE